MSKLHVVYGLIAALALSAMARGQSFSCNQATSVREGSFAFDTTQAIFLTPPPACLASNYGVYFRYVPSFTGSAWIGTCGSPLDTVIHALTSCSGSVIACNNDACGRQSWIRFNVSRDVPVWIRVGGVGSLRGVGTLTIADRACAPLNANDCCDFATIQNGPGSIPFSTTAATGDDIETCGWVGTSPDIWFRYFPSESGHVVIENCGSFFFDSFLSIHASCGGASLACNDDACGLQSRIVYPCTAGEPLLVRLAGSWGQVGSGVLTFSENIFPPNDTCANATLVGEGVFPFDTTRGTVDGYVESCSAFRAPLSNDVFYRYVPSFTGVAVVSTCGSSFDTVLSAHATCGVPELICSNDACDQNNSRIRIGVTQGVPVILRASGYAGANGAGILTIEQGECGVGNDCCETPTVQVGPGVHEFVINHETASNDGSSTCAPPRAWPDLWFRYIPVEAGDVVIRVSSVNGFTFSVQTACRGTTIACANTQNADYEGRLVVPGTPGEPILVRVAAYAGENSSVGGVIVFSGAAPPPNDTCATAMPVGEGAYPFDTLTATDDDAGPPCAVYYQSGNNDIYFRYTPTFTGVARISTCGSTFYTFLQAFAACGAPPLTCTHRADVACGKGSKISIATTAGVPVLIRLSGTERWPTLFARGSGVLTIEPIDCGEGHDCCATPRDVGMGTTLIAAGNATNDGSTTCYPEYVLPDVWFRFTAPEDGVYTFDACGPMAGLSISLFESCYRRPVACTFSHNTCLTTPDYYYPMTRGQSVLIRAVSFFFYDPGDALTIGRCEPFAAPLGAAREWEVCGANTNDACIDDVPSAEPLSLGVPMHGTLRADLAGYDYDTYAISLAAGEQITVCAQSEIPIRVVILEYPCRFWDIWSFEVAPCAAPATRVYTAPASGVYSFAVSPTLNEGFSCNPNNLGNNYWLSVGLDGACPQGGPGCPACLPDFNSSGGLPDDADVAAFLDAWSDADPCADANDSGGTPDEADVVDFFIRWNHPWDC